MDKADKRQISRHTSICISSSFHLSVSLIHIQMHTPSFSPVHTNIQRWTRVYGAGKSAQTQVSERAGRLHSSHFTLKTGASVSTVTCDAERILWKILEKAQRIKQYLKSLLCWIKKIIESRRSDSSTPRLISFISGRHRLAKKHTSTRMCVQKGCIFILVCA